MRILKCYYCSSNVYPGHGMTFARNDGRMFTFCRSKCHTHFRAKHNPKKSKWTKAHRISAKKEMNIDSVFQFEKRRNTPLKYNRELYIKTIQAMKRIAAIKEKRKLRFYQMRLRAAQERHLNKDKAILMKDHAQNLIQAAIASKEKAAASVIKSQNKNQNLMEIELR
eukprot:Gregarina_sp_Poly_1__5639@NODE_2974_length_1488_cov_157_254046_g1878_i0_p2_GENE_NODE_2974_length_1488_cov_157_254046_g1878_i0NODE_2974_length_1488_cov_157_254046_g1878_i0_p2_ORF_typecomplete_len167_score20_34Ribosomal_L24e/PF01246_20/4_5e26Ribosomal_L24e/PF01246_20/9_1e03DSBA/PF01323_20/0_051YHS/PF04945_13/0_13DUF2175/PF09943_9/0_19DUF2175/PF09943_9/2e02DUF702/PF05142_12/0_72DUF702/PF05142_12/4_4e03_NODE_2974_length_1488_cov_157_254046_g1878_i09311431